MANPPLGTVLRHLHTLAAGPVGRDLADSELLERFLRRREEGAFEALVRRHGRLVWSVGRRPLGHEQDAEDAFQATFLVLARHAPTIRKGTALASWLYGVAYRTALKARRDAARRRLHEQQAQTMPRAKPQPDP